eukprot:PhF_6_TR3418/c1_g1_i2/m.4950
MWRGWHKRGWAHNQQPRNCNYNDRNDNDDYDDDNEYRENVDDDNEFVSSSRYTSRGGQRGRRPTQGGSRGGGYNPPQSPPPPPTNKKPSQQQQQQQQQQKQSQNVAPYPTTWEPIVPRYVLSTTGTDRIYEHGWKLFSYNASQTHYFEIPSENIVVTQGSEKYIYLYNIHGPYLKYKFQICTENEEGCSREGGEGGMITTCRFGNRCMFIHCLPSTTTTATPEREPPKHQSSKPMSSPPLTSPPPPTKVVVVVDTKVQQSTTSTEEEDPNKVHVTDVHYDSPSSEQPGQPTLPPGFFVDVYLPHQRRSRRSDSYVRHESHKLLVTKGSEKCMQAYQEGLTSGGPKSDRGGGKNTSSSSLTPSITAEHCAHFYLNKFCTRGSTCNFVHVLSTK